MTKKRIIKKKADKIRFSVINVIEKDLNRINEISNSLKPYEGIPREEWPKEIVDLTEEAHFLVKKYDFFKKLMYGLNK